MGHPDGAGPAATAWQGTAPCGELPTPIATNFRLIVLQVRRYFKNVFVCFNLQERHNSWCIIKGGFPTLWSTLFLTSLLEALC